MNGYLQQQGLNRVQFSMQSCSSWFSVPSSTCVSLPVSLGDKEDIWLCDSLGTDCPGLGLAVLAHCGVVSWRGWAMNSTGLIPSFHLSAGGGFLGAGNVPSSWLPLQIPVPWSRECPWLVGATPNSHSQCLFGSLTSTCCHVLLQLSALSVNTV